jgi:hypothetical protein
MSRGQGSTLERAGSRRRRTGWSLTDQGLSSLTNFALTILVARSVTTGGFGAFELTASIYLFFIGASRAVGAEPLMVRHSDDPDSVVVAAAREATGVALVAGLVTGPVCLVIGGLLDDPSGPAIQALGLCLPGLLLQDSWRYVFFAAGRPAKAAANDGLWAVSQLFIVGWLLWRGDPSIAAFVLAWGASATIAAVAGAAQAGLVPRPLAVTSWLRRHRDLAPRFLGEFAVGLGSAQLSLWLIGVLGGLSILGALRAATVLIGPFRILLIAAPGAAIPELVRIRNTSLRRFTRAVAVISWTLAVLIAAWGVAVWFLPASIGEAVLGDSWDAAHSVLLWVTLSWSALGLATGALVGLRVLAAARRSFRARLVIAPSVLVVAVVGVELGDLRGAAAGLALASCGSAVVWTLQLRAALRDVEEGEGRAPPADAIDVALLEPPEPL